jgi:hypothetical protein
MEEAEIEVSVPEPSEVAPDEVDINLLEIVGAGL